MEIEKLYDFFKRYPLISTDTRNIKKDSIFFALKGVSFDGNTFAKLAIESGAKYAVISDKAFQENEEEYILVPDTLVALQELAKYHRNQLTIPVIGITGSNGKTTTKELIKSVLLQKFKTFATFGNLNNHIGVALSLLEITKEHEIAIIEMGANHLKEIEFLSNICTPDYGLITNIGKAHLEGFGSLDGVEKAKTELFQNLISRSKKAFINLDDSRLQAYVSRVANVTYGKENADCIGELLGGSSFLRLKFSCGENKEIINSNLIGTYNFNNILAAITIGNYFGLTPKEIKEGVENYVPTNNRSQIMEKKSNKIILDAYNANPSSMKEAISNLIVTKSEKKYFVLGDMLEMGKESEKEHREVVSQLEKNNLNGVLVGKEFCKIKSYFKTFETTKEAIEFISNKKFENTLILIKGSRGIKLESILDVI